MSALPLDCWSAEVVARRATGRTVALTLAAPRVAAAVRPGQYVAAAVGGTDSAVQMRRSLWISDHEATGPRGGVVTVVVDTTEPGGHWLGQQERGRSIDVVAPLGRPFSPPRDATSCLLVGFGPSTAPLLPLGRVLAARGCRVEYLLLGEPDNIHGLLEARRLASGCRAVRPGAARGEALMRQIQTETQGSLAQSGAEVVYSAGPRQLVRPVADCVAGNGLAHQVAVHEPIVCATGVCTGCVLPVRGNDGRTHMVRACAEGPVFHADQVRWDCLGTVPADSVGAEQVGA